VALLALVSMLASQLAHSQTQTLAVGTGRYQITLSAPLGAPDRWDYVYFDAPSHRVYVAHGDRVSVLDAISGQKVGDIEGTPGGAHGIAVPPGSHRGYTDDGEAGTVKVFDVDSLKVQKTLTAKQDADGALFDPASERVFVIDGDSGDLTAIDPTHDDSTATIKVGGKLEAAVVDGRGSLYVNGAGDRQLIRLDTHSDKVISRWPIPICESPHGLAIDTVARRLFVSCANARMLVLDGDSGKVVSDLPIGKGTDGAVWDPVRKRAFSSNGRDGTMTVIAQNGPDDYSVLNTVDTGVSGRTMDIDPTTGRIFMAVADVEPTAPGQTGRPKIKPGSLRVIFLDPLP
jgi:YVTN family beta-propeller protein